MRKFVFLLLLASFFVFFIYGVWQKEWLLEHGRVMDLPLRPLDPRSLMQGDYMVLNFALGEDIRRELGKAGQGIEAHEIKQARTSGTVWVNLDAQNEARFSRLAAPGQQPRPDEYLLQFKQKQGRFVISSGDFFFQEGTGKRYEAAKFARLRVADDGTALITHLLDEKGRVIE